MSRHQDRSGNTSDYGRQTTAEMSAFPYGLDCAYPTHDLIATYRRTCDLACINDYARTPDSNTELASIELLKETFNKSIKYGLKQLIESGRFERAQIENEVGPCRSFIHSERVLYTKTHLPAEVTFIAEMTNRNNEWVNLSPFGWVRHSDGPVFTKVTAPLRDPWRYRSELLYSKAAFAEEVAAIRAAPMGFVLGFTGRSFLVESAFHHIAEKLRPRAIYHSSITSLAIRPTSDVSVELTATLPEAGACEAHISYDRQTAKVSVGP
jgi:hypothetical protein